MIAAYAIGPSTAEAVHAGHVDMSRGVVCIETAVQWQLSAMGRCAGVTIQPQGINIQVSSLYINAFCLAVDLLQHLCFLCHKQPCQCCSAPVSHAKLSATTE